VSTNWENAVFPHLTSVEQENKKMSNTQSTMTTIEHLGPFELGNVSDEISGNVACKQGIPVVVKQTIGDKMACAVVAGTRMSRSCALVASSRK